MDLDQDGQINVSDFEKGLTKLGGLATCTKEDVRNLFSKMVTGGGVTANYRSFLKVYDSRRAQPENANTGDFQV